MGLSCLFIRKEALPRQVINGKLKHSCNNKIIVLCGLETNPLSLKHFLIILFASSGYPGLTSSSVSI